MTFQKLLATLIGVSTLAFAWTGALAAPIVSIDADPDTAGIQSSVTVLQGMSFEIDVVISGVDALTPLQGFEFDLFFDPLVLSATSVVDGGFLTAPVITVQNTIGAMSVEFAEVTFGPGSASGSGVLATIAFDPLVAIGESALDLQNVLLSAPFGVQIATEAVEDGLVGVIPEPTGALLFGAGLLLVVRRKGALRV